MPLDRWNFCECKEITKQCTLIDGSRKHFPITQNNSLSPGDIEERWEATKTKTERAMCETRIYYAPSIRCPPLVRVTYPRCWRYETLRLDVNANTGEHPTSCLQHIRASSFVPLLCGGCACIYALKCSRCGRLRSAKCLHTETVRVCMTS